MNKCRCVSRYLDTHGCIHIHVLCLRNMRWAAVTIEVSGTICMYEYASI